MRLLLSFEHDSEQKSGDAKGRKEATARVRIRSVRWNNTRRLQGRGGRNKEIKPRRKKIGGLMTVNIFYKSLNPCPTNFKS